MRRRWSRAFPVIDTVFVYTIHSFRSTRAGLMFQVGDEPLRV